MQAYLTYPKAAGEPPVQLRAFARVVLRPGQPKWVYMHLPRSDFQSYLRGHFVVVPGSYTVSVGPSSQRLPIRLTLNKAP